MSITQNVHSIRRAIEKAAQDAGRDPKEILLCAATKMNNASAIREAIAAGVDVCGENKVQELISKSQEQAYTGVPVHFIGHLQTNKVKKVVGHVDVIQSIDSLRLLEAVNREAAAQSIVQKILLQINIASEETKGGFSVEELYLLLPKIKDFSNLHVCGLMAIPPICQKPQENDKFFQKMYQLTVDIKEKKYDNVCVELLSMGMSNDYESAIRHGSTMIRIGTAIFGARDYTQSRI